MCQQTIRDNNLKTIKMKVTIALKRIKLEGIVCMWNEEDSGFKNFAGSVMFKNLNYLGFLTHEGKVELKRNGRSIGVYEPTNFIYA